MEFGFPIRSMLGRFGVVALLLGMGIAVGGAESSGSKLNFQNGLSLTLPPGWDASTMTTAVPKRHTPPATGDTLAVLLRAQPADPERTARITVIQDSTPDAAVKDEGIKRDILLRLNEHARLKGYQPHGFSAMGEARDGEYAILGEVVAGSPNGPTRIFACLAVQHTPEYSVRCFWEYDQSDATALNEFPELLSSITSSGEQVAASFVGQFSAARGTQEKPHELAPEPTPAEEVKPGGFSVSPKVSEFIEANRNALFVIEGEKGRGSGFVCNMDGQTMALTNAHVLAGNPQPKFTTMDGAKMELGAAFLGVDHDVCKISVSNPPACLEVMTPADGVPKIGDAIAVLGNSEGAGVIKPLEGKIVGLGPNLIEVDAPFVPGNSGSPIIHLASGKVIGIATYLIIRKVDENDAKGMESSVRRFGYRLDSMKNWEALNWPRFYTQATQAQGIVDVGEEFAELLAFFRKKTPMPQLGNNAVRRAVRTFEERLSTGRRMSEADMAAARREFLGNLRSATRSDLATFDSRTAYDYFRRQIADETKFRDALYEAFSKALESNR